MRRRGCRRNGWSRPWYWLVVSVLVLGGQSGLRAQERPDNTRSSLAELKRILLEAETLSNEQLQRLLSYESEIRLLRQLLNEQEETSKRLSEELAQSQTLSEQLSESLRDLRLQHEAEVAGLESRLRWSRVTTGVGTALGALGGFGLGRIVQ